MLIPVSIGVAGWSYPDWQGIVYPRGTKDQLQYLSNYVDCIEINSTFYRPPEKKHSQSWLSRTKNKEGFFFTAKLHKDFTHQGIIEPKMIRLFHKGFEPLLETERLRHLLIQFRYDFNDVLENRDHLRRLVNCFSSAFSLVVEVRHTSWEKLDAQEFLEQQGVIVANLDYPAGKNSFDLQNCTIGKTGYLRLHGRNTEKWFEKSSRDETYDYYYNTKELAGIEDRIRKLLDSCPSVVVIANNHYQGSAVANALELKASILDQKVKVPEEMMIRYPLLKKIAMNRPLF